MTAELRQGEPKDYLGLKKMRDADFLEIHAFTGKGPYDMLKESWENSPMDRWVLVANKEVISVGGISPSLDPEIGFPWAICSSKLTDHWRSFVRLVSPIPRLSLNKYRLLLNFVDVRNTLSINWLQKSCGFTIFDPQPVGPFGMLFHPFNMERDHV